MKKIETIKAVTLIAAMLGIILFWVFGFKENMQLSATAFFAAGGFALIFLLALGIERLRIRHYCF